MKKWIREFRVEIIALFAALLGIFLLVEQLEIYIIGIRIYRAIQARIQNLSEWFSIYFGRMTLSDFIGWVLLLGFLVFFLWRARWRYIHSAYYYSRECPKCGTEIKRARRTKRDNFLSKILFLKFHRYRCPNRECRWSGLRQPGRHHRKKETDPDFEAAVFSKAHEDVS